MHDCERNSIKAPYCCARLKSRTRKNSPPLTQRKSRSKAPERNCFRKRPSPKGSERLRVSSKRRWSVCRNRPKVWHARVIEPPANTRKENSRLTDWLVNLVKRERKSQPFRLSAGLRSMLLFVVMKQSAVLQQICREGVVDILARTIVSRVCMDWTND